MHQIKDIIGGYVMTEADVRKKMMEGFERVTPKVASMTTILMEVYQEGFNNCWELLTGTKFIPKEPENPVG